MLSTHTSKSNLTLGTFTDMCPECNCYCYFLLYSETITTGNVKDLGSNTNTMMNGENNPRIRADAEWGDRGIGEFLIPFSCQFKLSFSLHVII